MIQKHFYSSRDEEHGDAQILQIGVAMANLRHLLSHFTVSISDWLWENPPLTHKDKYLEIRNSIRSVYLAGHRLTV